jgi:hypothetical protein
VEVGVEVGRGGMREIAAFGVILTHEEHDWMRPLIRTHDEDDISEHDSGWPRWSRVYPQAVGSVCELRLSFVRCAYWPTLCGRRGLHFSLTRYFFVVFVSSFTSKCSLDHVFYV